LVKRRRKQLQRTKSLKKGKLLNSEKGVKEKKKASAKVSTNSKNGQNDKNLIVNSAKALSLQVFSSKMNDESCPLGNGAAFCLK
jgi:hypothetical protein